MKNGTRFEVTEVTEMVRTKDGFVKYIPARLMITRNTKLAAVVVNDDGFVGLDDEGNDLGTVYEDKTVDAEFGGVDGKVLLSHTVQFRFEKSPGEGNVRFVAVHFTKCEITQGVNGGEDIVMGGLTDTSCITPTEPVERRSDTKILCDVELTIAEMEVELGRKLSLPEILVVSDRKEEKGIVDPRISTMTEFPVHH